MKIVSYLTGFVLALLLFGGFGIVISIVMSAASFIFFSIVYFIIIVFNTPTVTYRTKPLPFKMLEGNTLWPF